MKYISKLFLLFTSLCFFTAILYKFNCSHKSEKYISTQIIESDSIEDVKNFIEPETLFVFDYDNVLVQGKEEYGFDAWFCAMLGKLEEAGLQISDAKKKLLPIYEKIQRGAEVKLVEICSKELVEHLKGEGYNVMILTVRSLCLVDSVFRQLESVGIDIKKNSISECGINSNLSNVGSLYSNGILFCDGYRKGEALKVFLLGKPELKVKNIVFVDDKLKNIESVQATAQELGLKFVGIRYGHTDYNVKSYKLDEKSAMLAKSLINQNDIEKNSILRDSQAVV